MFDKIRADRILPHVVPLLGVTFGRTQNVIEKSFLPYFSHHTFALQNIAHHSLQPAYPIRYSEVMPPHNKQVDVVRHEHISAHANIVVLRTACVRHERIVHRIFV